MRADDLDHKELLELDPEGGVIRFAGQRALLIDAVAMGLLRKYLVENFGVTAARTVLTQFGFAHGWRMAEAMQAEFTWENDDEWRRAGTRIHTLEGLFRVEPGTGSLSKEGATVEEAETGSAAVARASEFCPDLIAIDSETMDGDVFATATTLGWVHAVPVVFLVSSRVAELMARLDQAPWMCVVMSKSSGASPLLQLARDPDERGRARTG